MADSNGNATVTLTLPAPGTTVNVTAEGPFALRHPVLPLQIIAQWGFTGAASQPRGAASGLSLSGPERIICIECHEKGCAEGTLECGSSSYRLSLPPQHICRMSRRRKAVAAATALQGASRIFIASRMPQGAWTLCVREQP